MKKKQWFSVMLLLLLMACGKEKTIQEGEEVQMEAEMILAAAAGDTNKVLQYIEQGAEMDAQDAEGKTAVLAATYTNEVDTVHALIQKGANIDIQDNQLDNVMLHAGANGYLEIVRFAIEAEADMTITNRYGGTALIPAADRGHVEVVKELLMHSDVKIDHINRLAWTALLEAVLLGDGGKRHQEIVALLIEYGADVSIADGDGVTALEHAKQKGFNEMVDMLTKAEK